MPSPTTAWSTMASSIIRLRMFDSMRASRSAGIFEPGFTTLAISALKASAEIGCPLTRAASPVYFWGAAGALSAVGVAVLSPVCFGGTAAALSTAGVAALSTAGASGGAFVACFLGD